MESEEPAQVSTLSSPSDLPERVLGDECPELSDQVGVAGTREVSLDPLVDRRQTELLEAHCFRVG